MEMILFVGVQATGKSSFYRDRFFNTHVRINLDMLKTRNRERILLEACLAARQRFVVDNTNLTAADRAAYVGTAKQAGFAVIGYYFQSRIAECLARNATRCESERVPDRAVLDAYGRLEIPSYEEGFDRLHYVTVDRQQLLVEEWRDEV